MTGPSGQTSVYLTRGYEWISATTDDNSIIRASYTKTIIPIERYGFFLPDFVYKKT